MNIKNTYSNFKRRFYLKKLDKLLNNYNFFTSISSKVQQIFNDSLLEELTNDKNPYSIEISRNIIEEFIETSLFNSICKKNIKFSDEMLNFILLYRIDKIYFDNIELFKSDIDFLNKYYELKNKLN